MNRQQVISSAILAGMLVGYWFLLARGELATIARLQGEISSHHEARLAYEGKAVHVEPARAELEEVSGWLEEVRARYVIEDTDPDFLLDVATALRSCRLTPRETTPTSIVRVEPFTQQSIRVAVEGRLEDLLDFLQRMERGRPFCRVTELRVDSAPTPGEVRAGLTMLRLWRES